MFVLTDYAMRGYEVFVSNHMATETYPYSAVRLHAVPECFVACVFLHCKLSELPT